jgi:hypothetical protein
MRVGVIHMNEGKFKEKERGGLGLTNDGGCAEEFV